VIGVGDIPQNDIPIASLYAVGMADWNVAVDVAVQQEDRNPRGGYRVFWRNLLHIEAVFDAGGEEGKFNDRAEQGFSEPGAEVERLATRS
jgi:hypothetical protein